jgi:hypothetical protein
MPSDAVGAVNHIRQLEKNAVRVDHARWQARLATATAKMHKTMQSKIERFVKILKGEPIFNCPICERECWVDEHLCMSDMPHMPDYYVACNGECPVMYKLSLMGLEDRGEIMRLYHGHFSPSHDVWLYVIEQEYKGREMPSRGNRPLFPIVDTPRWDQITVWVKQHQGGEIKAQLGDGVDNCDCYFSRDGGKTPVPIHNVCKGDTLYWNLNYSGYDVYSGNNVRIEFSL